MQKSGRGFNLATLVNCKTFPCLQPIKHPFSLIPNKDTPEFYGTDIARAKEARATLKLRANDVLLSSYPKCGQHFLQKCCVELVRQQSDRYPVHDMYASGDIGQEAIPHLDFQMGQFSREEFQQILDYSANARECFLWNHSKPSQVSFKDFELCRGPTPSEDVLHSVFHEMAGKVIVLVRNPKDTITSGYHFFGEFAKEVQQMSTEETAADFDYSFEDYLSYFYRGITVYGDYFNWVEQWWTLYQACNRMATRHNPSLDLNSGSNPKILWLYYEDMVDNPQQSIREIAAFLDRAQCLTDVDVDRICEAIHIDNAKAMLEKDMQSFEMPSLLRTGQNGKWKEIMTDKQSDTVDETMLFKWAENTSDIRYFRELFPKFAHLNLGYLDANGYRTPTQS